MDWENVPYIIKNEFKITFNIIKYFLFSFFIIIFIFLINIQIFKGNYYYNIAEQNRLRIYVINAPRGNIYDRNYEILADNIPSLNVFYYPQSTFNRDEISTLLSILPQYKDSIFYALKSNRITLIAENISRFDIFRLLYFKHRISNIFVTVGYKRRYLYNENFFHLLGYVGEITQTEYIQYKSKGYHYCDIIGKSGIEKTYEDYLKGTNGALIMEVDAKGNPIKVFKNLSPQPGCNIYLTIDKNLQLIAREALKRTGKNGAIVGIDPRNGAIRILVSYKDLNPNMFIKEILKDKNLPMFNRAIQGQFSPGSTFKILTALAALNENRISPQTKFFCSGSFKFGDKIFKCWEKNGHGYVDLFDAIRLSCNVYFINLGLKLGVDNIEKYAKKFYFGQITDIDLPFEAQGVIPSKKWKKEKLHEEWFEGDTVSVSIGQGYITVTPLQLALFAATIANKGKIYKPYVVERITDASGNEVYRYTPILKSEIIIPAHIWDFIHRSMQSVVKNGTGYAAYFKDCCLAGKTGTAQNPHGEDHAWFICFGPCETSEPPQLALAILVEHGGKGGAVAAPIAKEIFLAYCKNKTNISYVEDHISLSSGKIKEYGD